MRVERLSEMVDDQGDGDVRKSIPAPIVSPFSGMNSKKF